MSDLVGNPEDQFSHNEAQLETSHMFIKLNIEPSFSSVLFANNNLSDTSDLYLNNYIVDLVCLGCFNMKTHGHAFVTVNSEFFV